MDYRQKSDYEQKDRLIEQIMIDQIRSTHFPDIRKWNPEDIVKEEEEIPLLTWESFRRFINRISKAQIPRDAQIIVTRHPGHSSTEHIHDHYEACYILSGSCASIINNHLEYLKKGDFCLIPPLARHDYEFQPDSLALSFSIRPNLFSGICAPLLNDDTAISRFLLDSLYKGNHQQYLLFQTEEDPFLRTIALTMFQMMLEKEGAGNQAPAGLLLAFFSRIAQYPHRHIQSAPSGTKLLDLELLNMIRKNYATITLEDLSRHLHYTIPHCSKYLKEHLGCTFSELVRQMRFQAAEDYLIHSDMSVTQISERLGYENPENFIRAFKKQYGITPNKYRQRDR